MAATFFSGLHQWANNFFDGWLLGVSNASGSTLTPIAPHEAETLHYTVIFRIRLPRILAAMLVGAGVSIAGTSFQGLFKNPLVSPDLLGVASGAGFGAALGILLSGRPMVIQASAFLAGIIAVAITYAISRMYRSTVMLVLVLSGIIVGALFSALISLIKYVADPYDTLPAIVFWLMGSLASVTGRDLEMAAPPILAASMVLFIIRWRINLLAMGDDEARTLGVNHQTNDENHHHLRHNDHGLGSLHQRPHWLGRAGGAPHGSDAGGPRFPQADAGFRLDRRGFSADSGQSIQNRFSH